VKEPTALMGRRSHQPPHSRKPKPNPARALALPNSVWTERGEEAAEEELEPTEVASGG
jgi:hypothetical protein